ncbi:MAG: NUDIX domain-containing protein [Chloroflexi bacterium]|nr:NUDIX domain-containing protein [Chloroflexota bacterium]MDA1240362.1 NUDIX domain-containing protein [Chloroflexota bacterium]
MRYCPNCSLTLTTKFDGGRERSACPDESCGFIHFGNFSIGAAAVVIRDSKALLVQRGWEPGRGSWQIPGGYVEHDEPILEAVEREVMEESGVTAKARDVIAFRHSIGGSIGGPSTNMYVVFRLDYIEGEPKFDNDEVIGAGFYSLDEMSQMASVQGLSRWAIDKAMRADGLGGLHPENGVGSMPARPGWQLFGLTPPDPDLM